MDYLFRTCLSSRRRTLAVCVCTSAIADRGELSTPDPLVTVLARSLARSCVQPYLISPVRVFSGHGRPLRFAMKPALETSTASATELARGSGVWTPQAVVIPCPTHELIEEEFEEQRAWPLPAALDRA